MVHRRLWVAPVVGAALLALTGMAIGQDSASSKDSSTQTSSSSKSSSSPQLPAKDKTFLKKAAQGGLEEVELGQMVQQKAESPEVKEFAQRMVTDHSKANDELKSLAQQKGVTLPTEMGQEGKALKARLEKLSGEQLDRAYMNAMVKDHTKDVAEFKQESTMGQDKDVKAWAAKTLPTLQDHLKQAKQIAAKETKEGKTTAK